MPNRSVTYDFKGKFDNLRSGLAAASRSVDDFGKKLTAADKDGARMRAGLSHFGDIGGKLALGATAGIAAIVGVTANFDKAMSGVQAATGESTEAMKELREAAIQAGADTAFSASEAAAGIENLAKAGVSTQDILGGGLQGALDLAAAGSLEVADAAEAAASAMSQFGLSGEDVPHIADLLAAAAGKAQGEVSDMAQALNQSGIIADQVGLSIEETTGGLAAFAEAGLIGSDAGTSFKTMLGALTPNSAKAKETMDELGISAYDAQGNFIGLAEFAGNLQSSLADLSNEQRNAALKTIFGSDAIRAATLLYENGADGVQEWIDKVDDSGFAAETAKTKLDNLAGDLEALKGSLETALIGAGEGSQGPLRKLVQGLTDVINGFNDMPPAAQTAVTAMLGITSILGGGLWFGSKVVNGIASANEALSNLGSSARITTRSLRNVVNMAAGLTAVGIAVTVINDAINDSNTIDTTHLQRELEALTEGADPESIRQLRDDFALLAEDWNEAGAVFSSNTNEVERETKTFFGLFGDTAADTALKNIGEIDDSLASMVESGQSDLAAAAFEEIKAQAEEAGLTVGQLRSQFTQYELALQNAGLAVTWDQMFDVIAEKAPGAANLMGLFTGDTVEAADATGELADETDKAADSTDRATPKIDRFKDSIVDMKDAIKKGKENLADARQEASSTAGEFFGLGNKVDKAKVSLSEWIDDLEKQAAALKEFRENAKEAADKGLNKGLIAALEKAGPTGALRMKQLADASEDEIKRVNDAWANGRSEMDKYVDQVTGPLEHALDGLRDRLKKLRDRLKELELQQDIQINVTYRTIGDQLGAHNIPLDRSTRHARGGLVTGPGGPTEDRVPALLSNREYVVKAAAVAKYGVHFFDQANAMRLASGGPVMRSAHPAPVGASIDYDRLASAMLRVRPLYGDVHLHNDGAFKRELLADAQRTGLGGWG